MSKGEQPQALGQSLQKSFATRWAPVGGDFCFGDFTAGGGSKRKPRGVCCHSPHIERRLSLRRGGGLASLTRRALGLTRSGVQRLPHLLRLGTGRARDNCPGTSGEEYNNNR
jgi:hypothetical protein